jgi:DNA polymerase elongation subunit (family B)
MRVLLLDIETAPNTAYVWRLFKENIPLARLMETSYVMCWAAKWLDEEEVFFDSVYHSSMHEMLTSIHDLLDRADVVVHFNGKSFDIPTLNKEFLINGIPPPAPYKQVDLMLVAKDKFRFVSNKLDHIAGQLGVGQKHDTSFELWVGCMNKDPEAWTVMKQYNIQDVRLLEEVYNQFIPWITKGPNMAVYADGAPVCPNCGSVHVNQRGFAYTTVGKFQRYQCKDCGTWSRNGINLIEGTKHVYRPVV